MTATHKAVVLGSKLLEHPIKTLDDYPIVEDTRPATQGTLSCMLDVPEKQHLGRDMPGG